MVRLCSEEEGSRSGAEGLAAVQGTNGGVTLAGLAASTAGGLFVGLAFYAAVLACPGVAVDTALREAALQQWVLIPAGESRS